jgi:hypothetical protein
VLSFNDKKLTDFLDPAGKSKIFYLPFADFITNLVNHPLKPYMLSAAKITSGEINKLVLMGC